MTCRRSSTKKGIFSGCRVSRKLVAIQPPPEATLVMSADWSFKTIN
jgi:hypothetical protein